MTNDELTHKVIGIAIEIHKRRTIIIV